MWFVHVILAVGITESVATVIVLFVVIENNPGIIKKVGPVF
jgi:hypothetical protein